MSRRNKIYIKKSDSNTYYDKQRNTYRKGCDIPAQPYYWFQGIGDITGVAIDILCTVAYINEHWEGLDLLQGDLGIVDKDNDFTVDSNGFLICTRPDSDKFSIDQSTADLIYS